MKIKYETHLSEKTINEVVRDTLVKDTAELNNKLWTLNNQRWLYGPLAYKQEYDETLKYFQAAKIMLEYYAGQDYVKQYDTDKLGQEIS